MELQGACASRNSEHQSHDSQFVTTFEIRIVILDSSLISERRDKKRRIQNYIYKSFLYHLPIDGGLSFCTRNARNVCKKRRTLIEYYPTKIHAKYYSYAIRS